MSHGGKRNGSGRKAKFAENELKEQILSAAGEDGLEKVWKKVFTKAKEGSITHINTLFAYFYGKPKETVQLDGKMITIRYDGGVNNLISPASQEPGVHPEE